MEENGTADGKERRERRERFFRCRVDTGHSKPALMADPE